jgi:hypothetical protein
MGQVADILGSVPAFLTDVASLAGSGCIFRGQSKPWPLLPKAGRKQYTLKRAPQRQTSNNQPDDLELFFQWRSQAIAYLPELPNNDFECLALAQHYGLATRLLDWSANPLVALYFACESEPHKKADGIVYCFFPSSCIVLDTPSKVYLQSGNNSTIICGFSDVHEVAQLTPRPFDRRVLMQSSCFTYHPVPNKSIPCAKNIFKGVEFNRVIVSASSKDEVLEYLSAVGISRKTLFPGLEGLSYFLNWQMRTRMKTAGRVIEREGILRA